MDMDIKKIAEGGLVEKIRRGKEIRKCIVKEVPIEEEELHISTGDLLKGYTANKKICEDFFPREIRKIYKLAMFDFGEISSKEAEEKMGFIDFIPANIYETLVGLGKTSDVKGDLFVSGSPSDPEDLTFSTFPMIKINGEKTITLNVDLKVEKRLFVGVQLVEKEKEVV